MFFTECAHLAEQYPDLSRVFERVDSRLREMGTAAVIRPDDLSSFLSIDLNQIRSALDLLTEKTVLRRVEMIECMVCGMAAPRSDYLQGLDEDDEYRCTSCDRALTDKTIQIITAYQPGERWQGVSNRRDDRLGEASPLSIPSNLMLDEQAFYTHDRLAQIFNVGKDSLRKRLDRHRKHTVSGWKVNEDRRPREAKYLYQLRAVKTIVEELRASSQRPAK